MKNLATLLLLLSSCISLQSQNQALDWAHLLGGTSSDRGEDITVDRMGNIYTVGPFAGTVDFDFDTSVTQLTANNTDAYIQKVDTDGQLLWAKAMGGTSLTWANAVVVDDSMNVYTIGFFRGTTDFDPNTGTSNLSTNGMDDFFVQKLDSNGNFRWAYSIGGPNNDVARDIAIDAQGNLYICGSYNGTVDFDPGAGVAQHSGSGFFIQKINPGGQLIWAQTYSGTGSGSHASNITIDDKGYIYCAGSFYGTVDFDPDTSSMRNRSAGNSLSPDAFILKLDTAGNYEWANTMGGNGNGNDARVYGIAVDGNENIFVTGVFKGTVDFDPGTAVNNRSAFADFDIFIQQVDSLGSEQWTHTFGRWSNDYGNDIVLDSSGNIYTIGFANSSFDFDPDTGTYQVSVDEDLFIHKLNALGQFEWVKLVQGSSSSDYVFGKSISIDSEGSLYTTGEMNNTSDFNPGVATLNLTSNGGLDAFIQKFSTCGSALQQDTVVHCGPYTWINGVTYTQSSDTITHMIVSAPCDTLFYQLDLTVLLANVDTNISQNGRVLSSNHQGTATFQWLDCGYNFMPIAGATNPSFTATQNGNYAVEITAQNGCVDTSACVAVINVGLTENGSTVNQLLLSPNPSNGQLQLLFTSEVAEAVNIQLYNANGQLLQEISHSIQKGKNQIKLDYTAFPNGIYHLQIQGTNFSQSAKVVLRR